MATTDRPDLVTRTDAVRALYADRDVAIDRLIEHGDLVLVLLTLPDGSTTVEVARVDQAGTASATRIS